MAVRLYPSLHPNASAWYKWKASPCTKWQDVTSYPPRSRKMNVCPERGSCFSAKFIFQSSIFTKIYTANVDLAILILFLCCFRIFLKTGLNFRQLCTMHTAGVANWTWRSKDVSVRGRLRTKHEPQTIHFTLDTFDSWNSIFSSECKPCRNNW